MTSFTPTHGHLTTIFEAASHVPAVSPRCQVWQGTMASNQNPLKHQLQTSGPELSAGL